MKFKRVVLALIAGSLALVYWSNRRTSLHWDRVLERQELRRDRLHERGVARACFFESPIAGNALPDAKRALEQVVEWRRGRLESGLEDNVYKALRERSGTRLLGEFLPLADALATLHTAAQRSECFVDLSGLGPGSALEPIGGIDSVQLANAGLYQVRVLLENGQDQAATDMAVDLLSYGRDLAQCSLFGSDARVGIGLLSYIVRTLFDEATLPLYEQSDLTQLLDALALLDESMLPIGAWFDWEVYDLAESVVCFPDVMGAESLFGLIDMYGIHRTALGGFSERGVLANHIDCSGRIADRYRLSLGDGWRAAEGAMADIIQMRDDEHFIVEISSMIQADVEKRPGLQVLIRIARMGLAAMANENSSALKDPYGDLLILEVQEGWLTVRSKGPNGSGHPRLRFPISE